MIEEPVQQSVKSNKDRDAGDIDALARRVRPEFPMLARELDGRPLAFLDSASTTPKPRAVIDAVVGVYERCTANVHRGVHALGQEVTQLFDATRLEAAALVGASPDEIVFVRGPPRRSTWSRPGWPWPATTGASSPPPTTPPPPPPHPSPP